MSIFWSSDHHIGHENIIKHCRRPFKDADEMDQFMVDAWNSVVTDDDEVFHLGDISHKRCPPERANAVIGQLKGKIHLILGNHETDARPDMNSFDDIRNRLQIDYRLFTSLHEGYFYIRIDGKLVVMSHYAMETWHDMSKGSWALHGHSHGKLGKKTRRLDVGVDTHDFRPWSWDEIVDHMGGKKRPGKVSVGKIETAF